MKIPEIIESGLFVKLTFFRRMDDFVDDKVDENLKVDDKVDENLKVDDKKVFYNLETWFKEHEDINIRQAMTLFALSKSGANKRLNELTLSGVLRKVGVGRATKYIRHF